jgi:hypothetical protein
MPSPKDTDLVGAPFEEISARHRAGRSPPSRLPDGLLDPQRHVLPGDHTRLQHPATVGITHQFPLSAGTPAEGRAKSVALAAPACHRGGSTREANVVERQFVRHDELGDLIRTVFGSSRKVVDIARLAGGSKKGVYRLALDDGTTSILYVWNDSESYWPASGIDPANPFADASGVDLFVASQALLGELGVRTPSVYVVDQSHRDYPADLALAEDIRGGTLEDLIRRSPDAAESALDELAAMLATMHRHHSSQLGKVGLVEAGSAAQDRSADQVVLDEALRHLTIVAARVAALAAAKERIDEHVRALAAEVVPRREYGLIHGELGPDHVLITEGGRPVLIDIEGLMFFDVEWEHAFLQMRFGPAYEPLYAPGLDAARLRFYEFAQSLSLIEGPLRIADGDFPGRDFMLGLATWHTEKVLRLASLLR